MITEMEDKRTLFRFYSEVDLKRVIDGMPWFFNRHLIIFHKVVKGKDLATVYGLQFSGYRFIIYWLVSCQKE
ncbi:hypothetical protein ES288_A08G055500v1 [Gossypium darwinii]|uniref:DUF4283 domain-containing protein n=1 Tax=Gossypium darwinii TaxID=34276 RepID=A0A5D2FGH4_GOSDA|nr:hypothetical protein ES288_A08G055500v1 [Gossypium darwinii]